MLGLHVKRLLHTTTISTFESVICGGRDRKIEILFLSVAYASTCPATIGIVYDQVKMIVYENLIYLLDYIIVDGSERRLTYLASHISPQSTNILFNFSTDYLFN